MTNVTIQENKELNGLELLFSEKPGREVIAKLKEEGFRWHNQKKLWYAKKTEKRERFALNLAGFDRAEGAKKAPEQPGPSRKDAETKMVKPEPSRQKKESQAGTKKPNTFAAYYSRVGSDPILKDSSLSLYEHRAAYFEDIACYYHRMNGYGDECIHLESLENAGKAGKQCTLWSLSPETHGELLVNVLRDVGIETVQELHAALRAGKQIEGANVWVREEKAVEVFSPFAEYTPLKKIPEEYWTKTQLIKALMSGQVFGAKVSYRYNDGGMTDSGKGRPLDLPLLARDVVEGWVSTSSAKTGSTEDKLPGRALISYWEHSNSGNTLEFDLSCNHAESVRRQEEFREGLARFNSLMESAAKPLQADHIDPTRIYTIETIDRDTSSGKYGTRSETYTGHSLLEWNRLDEDGLKVLSCKEFPVVPDHTYKVADFFHRMPAMTELTDDPRVISCGNFQYIVTGKALQELVSEGVSPPHIAPCTGEYGPT